jgi:hypothetical protein
MAGGRTNRLRFCGSRAKRDGQAGHRPSDSVPQTRCRHRVIRRLLRVTPLRGTPSPIGRGPADGSMRTGPAMPRPGAQGRAWALHRSSRGWSVGASGLGGRPLGRCGTDGTRCHSRMPYRELTAGCTGDSSPIPRNSGIRSAATPASRSGNYIKYRLQQVGPVSTCPGLGVGRTQAGQPGHSATESARAAVTGRCTVWVQSSGRAARWA